MDHRYERRLQENFEAIGQLLKLSVKFASKMKTRSFDELLLSHGFTCSKRGSYAGRDGVAGECFNNSFMFVQEPKGYVYCEGLACGDPIGLPIHHAWLLNPETGRVIDRTPVWSSMDRQTTAYYGLPVKTDFLLLNGAQTGYPSPFFLGERFADKRFDDCDDWLAEAPGCKRGLKW
jgi:hypothetical protein